MGLGAGLGALEGLHTPLAPGRPALDLHESLGEQHAFWVPVVQAFPVFPHERPARRGGRRRGDERGRVSAAKARRRAGGGRALQGRRRGTPARQRKRGAFGRTRVVLCVREGRRGEERHEDEQDKGSDPHFWCRVSPSRRRRGRVGGAEVRMGVGATIDNSGERRLGEGESRLPPLVVSTMTRW